MSLDRVDRALLQALQREGRITNSELASQVSLSESACLRRVRYLTLESLREVPTGVTITASHAQAEFTFEGQALAAYSIVVAGPSRSWTVSVVPVSGAVRCLQN